MCVCMCVCVSVGVCLLYLALNNSQGSICHKTQGTQTKLSIIITQYSLPPTPLSTQTPGYKWLSMSHLVLFIMEVFGQQKKLSSSLTSMCFFSFRNRSPHAVTLGQWHIVKISRTGRDGILEVDDQPRAEGLSQGAYTQLTLLQDLFIGGHQNYDETSKYANISTFFSGCIQKVRIVLSFQICSFL